MNFLGPTHSSKYKCFDPSCPDVRCIDLQKNKDKMPCQCSEFELEIFGHCSCKGQHDWSIGGKDSFSRLRGPGSGKLSCMVNGWDQSDYLEIWEQYVCEEWEQGYE